MADIVDSFVATLGLDPRQYNDEIKKYRQDRKRLGEEEADYNRARQDETKRLTGGIRELRNETAGLLFMLAGANGVRDFAANMIESDAATGRLAKNIGMATERLSAWQEAVKRSGGSSGDADSALRSMGSAFQSLQLTGTTGHDADFQGLGVTSADLRNPETALLKIAEASQRMSRPEFTARLQRIGLNDASITLLSRGRKGVEDLLSEVEALGVATDKSAEEAQRFETALVKIEQQIKAGARPAIEALATTVGDFADDQDKVNVALSIGAGVIGAVGVAALVAYAPIAGLAAVFAVLFANMSKAKEIWNDIRENGLFQVTQSGKPTPWKMASEIVNDIKENGLFHVTRGKTIGPQSPVSMARGAMDQALGLVNGGASRSGSGSSSRAEQYFRANGYTAAQSRGIVAAMVAENGSLNPAAHNRAGGSLGAYGLGQWRGDRLRALRAKYGPNPTFDQQLEFMRDEMRAGDAGGGGASGRHVGAAGTSSEAARAMIDRFYRPGPGAPGDYARAGRFLGQPVALGARGTQAAGNTVNNTTSVGQITVYTDQKSAPGIVSGMRGEIAKRGLVNQANTGLHP